MLRSIVLLVVFVVASVFSTAPAFAAPDGENPYPALTKTQLSSELGKVTPLAADPSGFDCNPYYVYGTGKFGDGDLDVWYSVYTFYRKCWSESTSDDTRFAEPTHTRASYNVEGDSLNCWWGNSEFTSLGVNKYYWRPSTGANWNPPGFTVPCDESSMNAKTVYYDLDDVPRLYWDSDGDGPKWKANVERRRYGLNRSQSIGGNFA